MSNPLKWTEDSADDLLSSIRRACDHGPSPCRWCGAVEAALSEIKRLKAQLVLRPIGDLSHEDVALVYVEDFATTVHDPDEIQGWVDDGYTIHGWVPLPEASDE